MLPTAATRTTQAIQATRSMLSSKAIAACVMAASLLAAGAAHAAEYVSIKGKTVNVREQPNTHSATLWELGSGYPLQVQQRRGQWLKVRDYEASLGWVYAPLTAKTPHRVVTARVANLRSGPNTSSRVVGKLEQHEIVRTLKTSGTWVQVRREDGRQGWVARSLTWGF